MTKAKNPALTPKQEAFCIGVVEGKTVLDAYKDAGYQPRASDQTRQQGASRLIRSKEIASRIAELRAPAATQAGMSLESHLADLQRLRDGAASNGQFGPAITAEIARGKASGVTADKAPAQDGKGDPVEFLRELQKMLPN